MSKKAIIITIVLLIILLAGIGGGIAAVSAGNCGYDKEGNFINKDGTVSAHGTMQDSRLCAYRGLLPDVVKSRLGWLGDSDTKAEAEEIKSIDEKVKAEIEAEKAKQ
tara:strand:- start:46 stop:366 length:321 start_codon:yes stop_codon:yes gene_type:complete